MTVPSGDYGPVPVLMSRLLTLARSGGLDALLLTSEHFYQTDYSKPLLFLSDGGYFPGLAQAQELTGSQWGMMNETGRYPGQAWLWLFTLWYQVPAIASASNADLLVVVVMTILSLGLLLVPFIPGVRDIPRWIPVHKLIWRQHYRKCEQHDEVRNELGGLARDEAGAAARPDQASRPRGGGGAEVEEALPTGGGSGVV